MPEGTIKKQGIHIEPPFFCDYVGFFFFSPCSDGVVPRL